MKLTSFAIDTIRAMSNNYIGDFISFNGKDIPVGLFKYDEVNTLVVYEVIRVMNSKPLFLEMHLLRLSNSLGIKGLKMPDVQDIIKYILHIIVINKIANCNIKLSLVYSSYQLEPNIIIAYIPSKYPNEQDRNLGVEVKTIFASRNEPNAKIENVDLRSYADEQIKLHNCYEVILVNEQSLITEGSRSNIFFIKDNRIFTASREAVLSGITLQLVYQISQDIGIELKEQDIPMNQLAQFESAFITGTSPGVLAIKKINDIEYNPQNPILLRVYNGYNLLVDQEIYR